MMKVQRLALTSVAWSGLGLGVPLRAWAQERPYQYGWGHPMWDMWGAWSIGMMVMWLLFWGLVIVGLVLGIR